MIKNLVASDKISLPPDFDRVLTEKLDRCTDQEKENLWMIVKYALAKRHEQRLGDLQKLEEYKKMVVSQQ